MTVWISERVVAAITREANNFYPLETGGLLLGWREGGDRIVTGVLGPGPSALHRESYFQPDHLWQVDRLEEVFAETDGDLDYLGDWHSHPDGPAKLSSDDRATLRRISRANPGGLMVILGGSVSGDWTVGSWQTVAPRLPFLRARIVEWQAQILSPPPNWPEWIALRRQSCRSAQAGRPERSLRAASVARSAPAALRSGATRS
jgi:integrative and conjugative element protein (TIGR02256 family)